MYCAAGVLVGFTSSARAITIDFESFIGIPSDSRDPVPESERLSDQFLATRGVVFSSRSPYVAVVHLGPGRATSGVNGIAGTRADGILSYGVPNPIFVRFFDPNNPAAKAGTDFVSIRIVPVATNFMVNFIAASASGYFIAYRSVSGGSELKLEISMPGIHSVQITCGNAAIDDFTFNAPKPIGVLYQSADLGPVGQTNGLDLQFGESLGVQFHLNKPVHATGIGAHFGALEGATPVARIVRLGNAARPSASGDFEAMAHSVGPIPPGPSREYVFALYYANLAPGHYALIVGPSNGPNFPDMDYSGRPLFFPGVDREIRGRSYIVGENNEWAPFHTPGRGTGFRFVLYGVTLD